MKEENLGRSSIYGIMQRVASAFRQGGHLKGALIYQYSIGLYMEKKVGIYIWSVVI